MGRREHAAGLGRDERAKHRASAPAASCRLWATLFYFSDALHRSEIPTGLFVELGVRRPLKRAVSRPMLKKGANFRSSASTGRVMVVGQRQNKPRLFLNNVESSGRTD